MKDRMPHLRNGLSVAKVGIAPRAQLSGTIVPDSGTGQLVGIAGKLTITITEGKHFYDLAYTLPQTP